LDQSATCKRGGIASEVNTLKIAVGLKAHSGWAALVVIGMADNEFQVCDRRRLELVEPGDADWAKQPYHAAEDLPPEKARRVVERGVESAHRIAVREMRALVKRTSKAGHEIVGCAVLVPAPMPDWTTAQILSVHMRMHKAEGVLFPAALISAATACDLNAIAIPEKELSARAEQSLGISFAVAMKQVLALGQSVGPPWGKDQKLAALAAMIAFHDHSS
jgi:hypothetical protein